MKVTRFPDWPSRLHAAIAARKNAPFEWGKNDCCLYAADIILAMTGVDPAEEWRGKYSDALGAARLLKPVGGISGMIEGIATRYGFRILTGSAYAQRGDVVEIDLVHTGDAGGPALGICIGAGVSGAGNNGSEVVPLLECRRAWRVG